MVAGRSYAVIAWGPFTDVSQGGVGLTVDLYSACPSTPYPGVDSSDYEPLVWQIPGHQGDHDSIIPATTGVLYVAIGNAIASAYTTHVLVIETTLFSPWWFTSGNNQAFVELRNNMNSATTAQLTFYRSDGAVCASIAVDLPANGNAALSIGALGTCAGGSGSSQIAFPGTPGGIIANTTTIDRGQRHVVRLAVRAENGLVHVQPLSPGPGSKDRQPLAVLHPLRRRLADAPRSMRPR